MPITRVTKLVITVPAEDLIEITEDYDISIDDFVNALDSDLYQWLRETAKWVARDRSPQP